MITYNQIGHFGRLGNQMFQFASTYGIAKKLGYEVAFPIDNTEIPNVEQFKDGITREVYFDIPKVFTLEEGLLKKSSDLQTKYSIQEPFFHYCEQIFEIPDNCNLQGYYQTERYFEHCQEDIRRLFTFKPHIVEEALHLFPRLHCDSVSIHIRIGDYIGLQNYHPICDSEYYLQAVRDHFFDDNYHFFIFSDNIDYCKDMFAESENISYIEGNSTQVDMCMMSMCNHNIIANSSFSWWAAWLNSNPHKKVVAPKKWFGPAYEGINDTKDLYCKNWIVI